MNYQASRHYLERPTLSGIFLSLWYLWALWDEMKKKVMVTREVSV